MKLPITMLPTIATRLENHTDLQSGFPPCRGMVSENDKTPPQRGMNITLP